MLQAITAVKTLGMFAVMFISLLFVTFIPWFTLWLPGALHLL